MATHEEAYRLLVKPTPGVYLSPEARETVLRALEEVEALKADRDSWRKIAERLRDARQAAIKALQDSSTVAVNPVLPPEIGPATVECVSPEKQASQEGAADPTPGNVAREEAHPARPRDGAGDPASTDVLCLAPGCAEPGEINGCCTKLHDKAGPNLRAVWAKARAVPVPEKQLFGEGASLGR